MKSKIKHLPAYLILGLVLITLGILFLKLPYFRIYISIFIGLSYFLWGIIIHLKDKSLHLPVVLEYFGLSLLAVVILVFISLRA